MDLGSILTFLECKSILVTGATGFIAKILVEKILRTQPKVGKLYLLVRAADTNSANQRLQDEMINKELFRVMKEKWGGGLNTFISEKVVPVAGDISCEDLGVKETGLMEEMWREVDVVVNLAATTNFDERYDIALGLNTMGPKYIVNFAKKCAKLKLLVHVSTAYVWGEKGGLMPETPFRMGEALNGTLGLDVDVEMKLVQERLQQLEDTKATEREIKIALKELGIERARKYGWPNTYVFTKAMGEMLVGSLKGDMPLVILRPTIITSTYKEPFPGWVEGLRTIDSLAVGYGKGRLTCFLGDPDSIIDAIPADMVVNSIIVAMAANASQSCQTTIYQVGSSVKNPVKFTYIQDIGYRYFTSHPLSDKQGKPVIVGKVKVLSTMASFNRYMSIRYMLPLKGLELVNAAFCQQFRSLHSELDRKVKFVMRLVELYRPYLFFEGIFDDINTEKLRLAAKCSYHEADEFCFDPETIDWEDYFMNIHIPGLVKYVLK
uniref:Fatty acyl-CoA reductase n=2 Tax=Kalanchoe fedtschenkoi TaxID=63787 RepID=A0A7N0U7L0_KALFE